MPGPIDKRALSGLRVALFEHRELDRLGGMLEAQGAATLRVPLVAIVDAPDVAPVDAWLKRFVEQPPDDLVLMTGEGLRRLAGFADRAGSAAEFRDALARAHTITRGPKPAQALRSFGLAPGIRAARPTTDGVIAALKAQPLQGRRVAVQLYPDAPNTIVEVVAAAGGYADPVSPYAYVPAAMESEIRVLIAELAAGCVDVVAFTSAVQVTRLFEAAAGAGLAASLPALLGRTAIAAVGPVVAAELERRSLTAAIMPRETYFMKPLVSAIIDALGRSGGQGAA